MKKILSSPKWALLLITLSVQTQAFERSGKILLTGGVSQVEGAAGGGLTPWAVIGGYGTEDQLGGNVFQTHVNTADYTLETTGALIGLFDRVEISYAKQNFSTQALGAALGLGVNFRLIQNIYGLKVKVFGDAVVEQDTWLPQIAIGAQHKQNERGVEVKFVGAKDVSGTDYYLSATKIVLSQSVLYNLTLRHSKANQLGLLGYGGNKTNDSKFLIEASLAYLVNENVAAGIEYRQKPDNLNEINGTFKMKENDWSDVFVAWAPTKNISATLAYAQLGNIVTTVDQSGFYTSLQVGF